MNGAWDTGRVVGQYLIFLLLLLPGWTLVCAAVDQRVAGTGIRSFSVMQARDAHRVSLASGGAVLLTGQSDERLAAGLDRPMQQIYCTCEPGTIDPGRFRLEKTKKMLGEWLSSAASALGRDRQPVAVPRRRAAADGRLRKALVAASSLTIECLSLARARSDRERHQNRALPYPAVPQGSTMCTRRRITAPSSPRPCGVPCLGNVRARWISGSRLVQFNGIVGRGVADSTPTFPRSWSGQSAREINITARSTGRVYWRSDTGATESTTVEPALISSGPCSTADPYTRCNGAGSRFEVFGLTGGSCTMTFNGPANVNPIRV